MLTIEQERTADEQFDALDVNGDGYVTEEDFVQTAERAAGKLSLQQGSEQHTKLVSAFRTWGKALLKEADTNKSNSISREEYVSALHNRTSADSNALERNKAVVEALWELMDANRDGKATKEEFRKVYQAFGRSDGLIDDLFSKLDQDHDNVLSKQEATPVMAKWGSGA